MPLFTRQPPVPTWHGTPTNLVERFLEFARRNSAFQWERRCNELRDNITDKVRSRADGMAGVQRISPEVKRLKQEVDRLTAQLIDTAKLDTYQDGLIGLMEHPSVLGIRQDSLGRLVVHVRLFGHDNLYVGDFEISLHTGRIGTTTEQLHVVQTDINNSDDWALDTGVGQSDGIFSTDINNYSPLYQRLLREGDLVGMLEAAISMVLNVAYTKRQKRLHEEPFHPTWVGITPRVEEGLAATIEWSINRLIRSQLDEATGNYRAQQDNLNYYTGVVRSANLRLSQLRAELEQLSSSPPGEIDEEVVRGQLRYMTSLPGVMGVKFVEDEAGEEVPVFHIRTTIVHDKVRYDMGDYELVFSPHPDQPHYAVVCVNQTRKVRGLDGIYYHPHRRGSSSPNWFCFGNRASQLQEQFRRGEYGEFLHLAISSLNNVNQDDTYAIGDRFQRIPMNAVWVPVGRTTRVRRRRQPRRTPVPQ